MFSNEFGISAKQPTLSPELERFVSWAAAQTDVVAWDDFSGGGVGVVRNWADDLKSLLNEKKQGADGDGDWLDALLNKRGGEIKQGRFDPWELAGKCVVFECRDEDKVATLARTVADHCGLTFVRVMAEMFDAPEEFAVVLKAILASRQPILLYVNHSIIQRPSDEEHQQAMLEMQKASEEGANQQVGDVMQSLQQKGGAAQLKDRYPTLYDIQQRNENVMALMQFMAALAEHSVPVVVVGGTPTIKRQRVSHAHEIPGIVEGLLQNRFFNRFFSIPVRSFESIGQSFIERLGAESCCQELLGSAAKLGKLTIGVDSHELQRMALYLHRKLKQERALKGDSERKIRFSDVLHSRNRDYLEADVPALTDAHRRNTAFHESGHVILPLLESDGRDVPEMVTAIPGAAGGGRIAEGYAMSDMDDVAGDFTARGYIGFRTEIRTLLAGRAAEEVAYGAGQVSTGASSDLERATSLSLQFFAQGGFAPDMDEPGQSGSNLAVLIGPFETPGNFDRLHELVRCFLQKEYVATIRILNENRPLLDAMTQAMMESEIVDEQEIEAIYKDYVARRSA